MQMRTNPPAFGESADHTTPEAKQVITEAAETALQCADAVNTADAASDKVRRNCSPYWVHINISKALFTRAWPVKCDRTHRLHCIMGSMSIRQQRSFICLRKHLALTCTSACGCAVTRIRRALKTKILLTITRAA